MLTKAMVVDGKLGADDIQLVLDAKKHVVERDGALEYFPVEQSMADVASMNGLKTWLRKRRELFLEPERALKYGLTFPQGILLLGVPGCGKSLCAKAVANEWGLPLLKLDSANLYNKYIGESERNFNNAIRTASRMAPVVLWIDELEKALAGVSGGDDSGTAQRIFGSFLSWMQDHKDQVFVVATANNIQTLPAEFLRKGRFDEIFFVDLPSDESRCEILRIHLKKRNQDDAIFDIESIAKRTTGFSGAELEQVVVASLFSAFSEDRALTSEDLLREATVTRPLSVTRAEEIAKLRAWAAGRVRSAD